METLTALSERVHAAIPLAHHLHFRYGGFDGRHLKVTAPLAPNCNDKGTFFAGSQSALLTLAGWSLTTLLAECEGPQVDVVAVDSSIHYSSPLTTAITITASAEASDIERFHQRLARRGKATLRVLAQGASEGGEKVCEYQGLYLARILSHDG